LPAVSELDLARELTARLPADADACVVARPRLLAADVREDFGAISQADAWLWQPGPGWLAYAHAVWTHDGKHSWLTLLSFDGEQAAARVWLSQHVGLELDWAAPAAVSCADEPCPTRAAFLDAHTLELSRGATLRASAALQHGSPCARLLREQASAFEVSFRREEPLFNDAASDVPLQSGAWAVATATGVLVQRQELMADSAAAERALDRDACSELWGSGSAALDVVCERSRRAMLVLSVARMRWDDLHMRRNDAQRHALAQQYAAALERMQPDTAVDWSNLEAAWQELSVRRALLAASTADRRPMALELLRATQKALALHPDEPRLQRLNAELERIGQPSTTRTPKEQTVGNAP